MITPEQCRSLAIAYELYLRALRTGDHEETVLWGKKLIEAQDASGVGLISSERIKVVIRLAEAPQ